MKKDVFLGLLVILMVISFIGCGDDSNENKEFTVTFELEGGNINGNTNSLQITVKSGEIITNFPEPLKINGYLNGWFTKKNGVGNEFTLSTKVLSNQTVYANWINPFIGEWQQYMYSNDIVIDDTTKRVFLEDMTWMMYFSNNLFYKGTYSFIGSEIIKICSHNWQSLLGEWFDDYFTFEANFIIIDDNQIKLYENGFDTLIIWEKF